MKRILAIFSSIVVFSACGTHAEENAAVKVAATQKAASMDYDNYQKVLWLGTLIAQQPNIGDCAIQAESIGVTSDITVIRPQSNPVVFTFDGNTKYKKNLINGTYQFDFSEKDPFWPLGATASRATVKLDASWKIVRIRLQSWRRDYPLLWTKMADVTCVSQ